MHCRLAHAHDFLLAARVYSTVLELNTWRMHVVSVTNFRQTWPSDLHILQEIDSNPRVLSWCPCGQPWLRGRFYRLWLPYLFVHDVVVVLHNSVPGTWICMSNIKDRTPWILPDQSECLFETVYHHCFIVTQQQKSKKASGWYPETGPP